jgi:hypothetical protein
LKSTVIVSALEYLPKTLLIITLRCASAACLRPGYGFTTAFRPKVFAYHGWDDINNYINSGSHCTDPQRCTVRALLTALPDGTWSNSIMWDTEVAAGQNAQSNSDPVTQACAASYLLDLTAPADNGIRSQ